MHLVYKGSAESWTQACMHEREEREREKEEEWEREGQREGGRKEREREREKLWRPSEPQ